MLTGFSCNTGGLRFLPPSWRELIRNWRWDIMHSCRGWMVAFRWLPLPLMLTKTKGHAFIIVSTFTRINEYFRITRAVCISHAVEFWEKQAVYKICQSRSLGNSKSMIHLFTSKQLCLRFLVASEVVLIDCGSYGLTCTTSKPVALGSIKVMLRLYLIGWPRSMCKQLITTAVEDIKNSTWCYFSSHLAFVIT